MDPRMSRWLLRREPRFARLWAAKAVSRIGDGAALVALIVYVQQSQGKGVTVSALLLAYTLPILLGPIAGALADRVDQRRLMIGAEAGQALLYGTIAAALPPFPVLLALVAAASVLRTLSTPAGRSAVPTLVSSRDLVRANSWMGMTLTLQGTLGPAFGGFLVAVAGIRGALLGNALTFVISAALLAALPALPPEPTDEPKPSLLRGTREGLVYTLRHPVARALAVGLGFGVMFAAVDDVALIFLARDELGAGALGYGVLASAYGVGLALGSLALMRGRTGRAEASFVFGLFLTGAGGLLTGLAPVFWLAALTQAVAGTGNGLDVVATDTLVQRSVPRSHRGRVFGVVSAATLIGAAVARGFGGVLLDLTSARATFIIGGSGVLLVTALSFALFRAVATDRARGGEGPGM